MGIIRIVKFPGLALEFKVPKVAFQLFGVDIYYYALCIVVGIIVALILCRSNKEKYYINFDCVMECTIMGLIMGIIGARVYYLAFNLKMYARK